MHGILERLASSVQTSFHPAVHPHLEAGRVNLPVGCSTRLNLNERNETKGVGTTMAKLNIRPLGDKVIVKRVDAEEKTAGGIVLPDSAKEKPKRGIILAVGNGRLLDDGTRSEMQVSKNDEVVFTSYAGTEIRMGSEEYMIMDESDILGIVG